jgi:serine/threonine protein kinase
MANLEGVILSDYLLLECISRSSLADVYRACQHDASQYEVAVKVFRVDYAEREAFRSCFIYEADKIGKFAHPYILPLLEYGEGKELLYAVTPFIKSGTLEDLLRDVGGKCSVYQVLPIVEQLCAAVEYAHEHEVLHGNIKPTNVFVASDGRLLLADFGIARGYAAGQQSLIRMEWSTTAYAAPEQSLGLLSRASDIYALGALTFRLLTGVPVFSGQTPVEVLLKHVRQEPPSARSLEAGITDAVARVLQQALSKRAEDRHSSALAFYQAFASAVALTPAVSRVAQTVATAARVLEQLQQSQPAPALPSFSVQSTYPLRPAPQAVSASPTRLPSQLVEHISPSEKGVAAVSPDSASDALEMAIDSARRSLWEDQPTRPETGSAPLPVARRKHEQKQPQRSFVLPVLVVILLILGLLGALISSWFFPALFV